MKAGRFPLIAALILCAASPARADSQAGDVCANINQIYTDAESANYPGPNTFICDGAHLQIFTAALANPTRLGIGTAAPTATLDVNGDIRLSDGTQNCSHATDTGAIRFNSITFKLQSCKNGTGWTDVGAGSTTPAGSSGYIQFNSGGAFGADSKLFWDNTNKRLGIGTATPAATLDVVGPIYSRFSNNPATFTLVDGSSVSHVAVEHSAGANLTDSQAGDMLIYSLASNIIFSADGWDTHLYIKNNGNVGIGTASPAATLDVNGDIRLGDGTQNCRHATDTGAIRFNSLTSKLQSCVNGTGWADVAGSGGTALSAITAATGTNTIANAANAQTWNWDTLAGASALKLGSTSTAAASNAQKVLEIALSGTNGTSAQTTYGEYISNTHAGTTSTNVGLYATATGGTTANYAAIFAAGKVGIDTTTPAAPLDVNGEVRIGSTTLNCHASTTGAIRYNSLNNYPEFCNGTAWTVLAQVQGTTPPTAPAGSGYFVLSGSTYTGNLGGLTGADAKCLTDLTTNTGWAGHATASSNGQLVAGKVHAWLCYGGTCNNLMPLTTYYYANAESGQGSAGGASFTTDSSSLGPGDSVSWAAANRFSGSYIFWNNHYYNSGTQWQNSDAASVEGAAFGFACGDWSSNSSNNTGMVGATANTDYTRWFSFSSTPDCSVSEALVCFVNP